MKICLVQSFAERGIISKNIENHIKLIHLATQSEANLIVFPELSLTGYEPTLAHQLAFEPDDSRLNVFQNLSDTKEVTICIGVPINSPTGITISMIFFQPKKEKTIYSKQMLHEDELPYFECGNDEVFLMQEGKKITFGICYESSHKEHILKAVENKADLYIASVAKDEKGISKSYQHFPFMARKFNLPILMSNSVGYCDNFMSNGKSAIWNSQGELVAHLDENNEGVLIYDTELEEVKIIQIGEK